MPKSLGFDDNLLEWSDKLPKEEKELPATRKTEEEIKAFTVDEGLTEVERSVLYLNGGHILQQRQAITNLPSVIKVKGKTAWDAVHPALKLALNKLDAEAHIDVAVAFCTICNERMMAHAELQHALLPIISRNLSKEGSEEEIAAWLDALFALMPLLKKETLISELVPLALTKGASEERPLSRCIFAHMLGPLALHLGKDIFEEQFLSKALRMCQDVDFHVRMAMCEQLDSIGKCVGQQLTSSKVFDELLELLQDEELKVSMVAFKAMSMLLWQLSPEVRRERAMPVLRHHMQHLSQDILMQQCIAKLFGTILTAVRYEMQTDDYYLFCGCFRHLATSNDAETRALCARQVLSSANATNVAALSANTSFSSSLKAGSGSSGYMLYFHDIFLSLTIDPAEGVRQAAAEQLPGIMKLVPVKEVASVFKNTLLKLLRDDSLNVSSAILPHLVNALTLISEGLEVKGAREAALGDVAAALVDLEAQCSLKARWRPQRMLASCFPAFVKLFSKEQMAEHFLPMVFRWLSPSAAAVLRPHAAEGMALLLRHGLREKQRAEVYMKLIRVFARGKTFSQRIAFIQVAQYIIKSFSSKYVREWVFDLCMELMYDQVPIVRLQVTPLLPALKQGLRIPEDIDLLERLNNAMSNAVMDDDRDVNSAGCSINDAFKRVPVCMGGGMQAAVEPEANEAGVCFESIDMQREAEENICAAFTQEEAKEIRLEILQLGIKKKAVSTASTATDHVTAGGAGRRSVELSRSSSMGSHGSVGILGRTISLGSTSRAAVSSLVGTAPTSMMSPLASAVASVVVALPPAMKGAGVANRREVQNSSTPPVGRATGPSTGAGSHTKSSILSPSSAMAAGSPVKGSNPSPSSALATGSHNIKSVHPPSAIAGSPNKSTSSSMVVKPGSSQTSLAALARSNSFTSSRPSASATQLTSVSASGKSGPVPSIASSRSGSTGTAITSGSRPGLSTAAGAPSTARLPVLKK
ncbi:hypothetical protein CEUSTIGMA_g6560.t1 [Chlamydomonas eustigma]|uniref:TOG domain-containing protein n=1 Tax=Chlamydomonas eustigma TaxID=1157962 RepID=A0A250X8M6_9CHLO|nr:hypothetical protein CEUSTIGMA_g6560.t1 [Chlamydomonas eustigma]|eukprot:GAX79120.1 hypothetical protein CEUSTIGMA_g6560.t1 [Chlamydomonas eustigma]